MSAKPEPLLTLPRFDFGKRQPDPPHVARTIAECVLPNEHGVVTTFCVKEARNRKTWWIEASRNKWRASNTLRTQVRAKADVWLEAVRTGRIRVERG